MIRPGGFPHFCLSLIILLLIPGAFLFLLPCKTLEHFLKRPCSTRVLDRRGELIASLPLPGGIHREGFKEPGLPSGVTESFIAAEDNRFFLHPGVDPAAIATALFSNITSGRTVSGASTITMQLVNLIWPVQGSKTWLSKAVQITRALYLELKLSKREILHQWMASLPFAGQVEGIYSAARYYYGRDAADLSLPESLILSVIPRNPGFFDPLTRPADVLSAVQRLRNRGNFPVEDYQLREILERMKIHPWPNKAPHFVLHLAREGYLAGDLTDFESSLDLAMQRYAEADLSRLLRETTTKRISQGAVLAVNPATGEILVYLGSRSFHDSPQGQIDGVQILNQPGSCLKPLLFALGMEKGLLPNDTLPDLPREFPAGEGLSGIYIPRNFNQSFHGPVRVRVALASSLNIPAVELLHRLGVKEFSSFLLECGFSKRILENDPALGLALGNGRVSLWELVRSYTLFSSQGLLMPLTPRKAGTQRRGEPASKTFPGIPGGKQVISPYAAGIVRDILADPGSRFLGFGASSRNRGSLPLFIKTGTSNQFQNIWAVAGSPNFLAGVWMGNFTGETVRGETGSSLPASLAANLLKVLEERYPGKRQFPVLADTRRVRVCTLSGGSPGPYCTSLTEEILPVNRTDPPECSWHTPQGVILPGEYSRWLKSRNRFGKGEGDIRVIRPVSGSLFYYDPSLPGEKQALRIELSGGDMGPISAVVNGEPAGILHYPYQWDFPLRRGRFMIEFISPGEGETLDTLFFEVR